MRRLCYLVLLACLIGGIVCPPVKETKDESKEEKEEEETDEKVWHLNYFKLNIIP